MTRQLLVEHPPGYAPERAYIHDVMLREFLGLEYQSICADRLDVRITLQDDPHKRHVTLGDALFQTPADQWLAESSLPRASEIEWWDTRELFPDARLTHSSVPAIYQTPTTNRVTDGSIELSLDIFGSAFFMLTRYEEVVSQARDEHDRFPASASMAFKEGFLDRPIVNEYLEILWAALHRLWPALERRDRVHEVVLTHDVDWPLCTAGRSRHQVLRTVAADVFKRRDVGLAARRLSTQVREGTAADPCNTFDFMLNLSERCGLKSAFYFIAGNSAGEIDGCYTLDDPWIGCLARRIHERGHEIGLHPSYNTYRDLARTQREFDTLRQATERLGIGQERWGGRQHYLRWENPTTWQNWEDAGLNYDSTLGFADGVGFRSGFCYGYPVFNLLSRRKLDLQEQPLVVMETTLFKYMQESPERSIATVLGLNDTVRRFNGNFTMLWHNHSLVTKRERDVYQEIVEGLTQ